MKPALIATRLFRIAGYATAVVGLFFTAPAAFGMPWCRFSGSSDIIEIDIWEQCPVSYKRVYICDAEVPSGRLRVVPVGERCPDQQGNESRRIIENDGWRGSLAGLPSVLVMPEGGAVFAEHIEPASFHSEPTPFDRHFGAFIGSMGFAALAAGGVALYRFGKRRIQPSNKTSPTGLLSEHRPSAAWNKQEPPSGGKSAAKVALTPSDAEQDAHYLQALDELDAGSMHRVTWARSLAASDGDNGRARAEYIVRRVAQLAAGPV